MRRALIFFLVGDVTPVHRDWYVDDIGGECIGCLCWRNRQIKALALKSEKKQPAGKARRALVYSLPVNQRFHDAFREAFRFLYLRRLMMQKARIVIAETSEMV